MYVSNSIPESYFKAIADTNYGTYPVPKGSKGHAQSGLFEESLIKELSAKAWTGKPKGMCNSPLLSASGNQPSRGLKEQGLRGLLESERVGKGEICLKIAVACGRKKSALSSPTGKEAIAWLSTCCAPTFSLCWQLANPTENQKARGPIDTVLEDQYPGAQSLAENKGRRKQIITI